jgi:hypothetical protein
MAVAAVELAAAVVVPGSSAASERPEVGALPRTK